MLQEMALGLQEELYNRINEDEVSVNVKCPSCGHDFEKEFGSLGE
jgi:hypothetical protein